MKLTDVDKIKPENFASDQDTQEFVDYLVARAIESNWAVSRLPDRVILTLLAKLQRAYVGVEAAEELHKQLKLEQLRRGKAEKRIAELEEQSKELIKVRAELEQARQALVDYADL